MSAPSALRAPWLPRLVVAPSFVVSFLFIYGLIAWNGYLSVSASRLLPNYEFVGLEQYVRLFESERFHVALTNMAIFGTLFIGGSDCCWPSCWTRRSVPRECCERSTFTRWRSASSSPARRGSGC
jgi:hypothetical protein